MKKWRAWRVRCTVGVAYRWEIQELELWTGMTSHEMVDNVDSLEWNMEAKLKIKLMSVQEEELRKVLEFLVERNEDSEALNSILEAYMQERSNLIQKLSFELENAQTDHAEVQM